MFDMVWMNSALQEIVAMKMQSSSLSISSPTYGSSSLSSLSSESGARSGTSSMLTSFVGMRPAWQVQTHLASLKVALYSLFVSFRQV
jgi:hypothetical protein